MDNTIFQYVYRNRKPKPTAKRCQRMKVGIMAASKSANYGVVHLGWCLTNTSRGDKFSPKDGWTLVRARMLENGWKVPHSLTNEWNQFVDRCKRYFKTEL